MNNDNLSIERNNEKLLLQKKNNNGTFFFVVAVVDTHTHTQTRVTLSWLMRCFSNAWKNDVHKYIQWHSHIAVLITAQSISFNLFQFSRWIAGIFRIYALSHQTGANSHFPCFPSYWHECGIGYITPLSYVVVHCICQYFEMWMHESIEETKNCQQQQRINRCSKQDYCDWQWQTKYSS